MSNPADEIGLVEKALRDGLGGCVEWDGREVDRVRREMGRHGLTPEGIRREAITHVQNGGHAIQIMETRQGRGHRKYWYKLIIPMPDLFPKGLFVEMELFDFDDPDLPEVRLLNAHEQK